VPAVRFFSSSIFWRYSSYSFSSCSLRCCAAALADAALEPDEALEEDDEDEEAGDFDEELEEEEGFFSTFASFSWLALVPYLMGATPSHVFLHEPQVFAALILPLKSPCLQLEQYPAEHLGHWNSC